MNTPIRPQDLHRPSPVRLDALDRSADASGWAGAAALPPSWSERADAAHVERLGGDLGDAIARDPAGFADAMRTAFGDKADLRSVNALIDAAAADRLPMPSVRIVGPGTLGGGALGAYAARGGPGGAPIILLDRSLLSDGAALRRTFTEEYGHHLDALLGGPDSAGDEGEMFAAALLGDGDVPESAFARMTAENDRGTVLIDGRALAAEFDRPTGAPVGAAPLSAEERAWCTEQERLIRSVLLDEGVAADDATVGGLSAELLGLRRAHALARSDGELEPMRTAMHRADDAFAAAGFGHLVATLPGGVLGARFTGATLPDGLSRNAFRYGSGDSDNPANETHHVPLRFLSPERQLDMAAAMLSAPADRARHTGLEAWGDRDTGSELGPARATIASSRAAPPTAEALESARDALDEQIDARLRNASTKTDFEHLSALYVDRASLELTGRADGPGGLTRAEMMELRRWMGASGPGGLGYSSEVELWENSDEAPMTAERPYGNFGRTKYEFAQVWLASSRAERLAWVGVDEATWTAAEAELDRAVEASRIADELDRGIGGFVRDPLEWTQNEVLRPVTDAVLRPIVEADIPILSDGALMAESAIHGGYDLVETGVDVIGDTATELGHDGVDGAWGALADGAEELGGDTVDLVTTQGAIALSAGIDAIERLTGQVDRRGLSAEEITAMRPVFGDSIDYDAVVIRTGGIRDSIGMSAHAVAYEIQLTEEDGDGRAVFEADGETLTAAGLRLLAHELTHTWQYERFGPGYIGEALHDNEFGQTDETYEFRDDLAAGTDFLDMRPEAQASLIEAVYAAISLSADGRLDLAEFNRSLSPRDSRVADLTAAEFEIVVRAHAIVSS